MLETKEQKNILLIVGVLIVILSLVSLWGRSNFIPQSQPQDKTNGDNFLQSQAYLNYLNSLEIDKQASQELFQEILSEEDIRNEVEKALKVDQVITLPEIDERDLNISGDHSKEAMENYLSTVLGYTIDFNDQNKSLNEQLFSGDLSSTQELMENYQKLYEELKGVETPEEMLGLHKSMLKSYVSYGDLIQTSKQHAAGDNENSWPELYHDYAVVNDQLKFYRGELNRLANEYQISAITVKLNYAQGEDKAKVPFIKTTHAFLGFGDLTVTIGDIPRIIKEAIQEGLVASFSQFMGSMINNLIDKIESNYLIANFLYYTDALVAGQYTEDYLAKYVSDDFDREVIKTFIPQFSCGAGNEFLAPVFKAKAQEYLGFDANLLSPNDPDYYNKMARVGSFLSSPQGWQLHYQDIANIAKSEAEKSAERELTSPGLKTPRDSVNNAISQSINSIVSAQRASFNAIMQLGIQNAEYFISSFISSLTQSIINKYVFRGVTGDGSLMGVLKEQPLCMAAAQLQLVLPAEDTEYIQPPLPPDEQTLIQQACEKTPRGCEGVYSSYTDFNRLKHQLWSDSKS